MGMFDKMNRKRLEILEKLEADKAKDREKLKQDFADLKNSGREIKAAFMNVVDTAPERAAERNRLKCPKCKSHNVQFAGNNRKGFSVGKAVAGAALTGGVGTLAGFAGKKGKKNTFICMDCGKSFEVKG